jgi:hypothetical protein
MVANFQTDNEQQIHRAAPQSRRWEPPKDDYLKMNIDGAFRQESATGACGFIIRNSRGDPVMAGASN